MDGQRVIEDLTSNWLTGTAGKWQICAAGADDLGEGDHRPVDGQQRGIEDVAGSWSTGTAGSGRSARPATMTWVKVITGRAMANSG